MTLFKYLHPDRTDVLRGLRIRFTSPAALNDPFELKPHIAALASQEHMDALLAQLLPDLLREALETSPLRGRTKVDSEAMSDLMREQFQRLGSNVAGMAEAIMPRIRELIAHGFEQTVGILCLSESSESLLMWAHYADSHRGFVIEFDEKSAFFDRRVGPDDELRHLRKVNYSSKRPSVNLADIEGFSTFMVKGIEWMYEAEWRMIVPLQAASQIIGQGPLAIHLFQYPPKAIKSIILGCRMSPGKKAEIRQILSEVADFDHVRCFDAEIDEEHYQLRIYDPAT